MMNQPGDQSLEGPLERSVPWSALLALRAGARLGLQGPGAFLGGTPGQDTLGGGPESRCPTLALTSEAFVLILMTAIMALSAR